MNFAIRLPRPAVLRTSQLYFILNLVRFKGLLWAVSVVVIPPLPLHATVLYNGYGKMKKVLPLLLIFIILITCNTGESGSDSTDNICGQEPCYEGPFEAPWISGHYYGFELVDYYTGQIITYDNRVLETENCLIFSDASDDWAKIRMGETAEASLRLVKELFDLSNEDMGIVDRVSKFRVFSCRGDIGPVGPNFFYNGYIIWAWDSYDFHLPEWIPDTAEHECVHVAQFKMGGSYNQVWAWFREGLAEHISDGGPYRVIRCREEVDEWRRDPDHQNPITIQNLDQMPNTAANRESYYPIFGVAVRWLVAPGGNGKTLIDVKNMFRDIGNGMEFVEAFELHMGLTVEYYEEHFWEWMEAYLPASCD